jgi:succinoglycan biosynthesis transport protein ExoP
MDTNLNTSLQTQIRAANTRQGRELTFSDLWNVLMRRRAIIVGVLACAVTAAVLYCMFTQRRYRATGQLQVQKTSLDGLGLSSLTGDASGAGDALDSNITIQTEATILQSDTLALRVIKDLNLDATPDFQPRVRLLGLVVGLLSPKGPEEPANTTFENSPRRRSYAVTVFHKNLNVKIIPGTRLINVSYTNPDPKLAADVVNHLILALEDFSFQTRYTATSQASQWLSGQLSDLRKDSEDLQAKVVQLQKDTGVFTLGGGVEGEGKSQAGAGIYSSVLDRLQQATATMTQAESNRILKRAIWEAAKAGNPELISGLAGNAGSPGLSNGISNSLTLIQNLRLQQATQQGQLQELSAKFGPAYPKLEEVRSNLAAIDRAIHDESIRIEQRARNDYEVAKQVEDGARSIFNQQKRDADQLNNKAIEYMIVRQEAEQSRGLYETLLGHLKEAGVLEGLRSSNVSIVDPARVPAKPSKPNVPFNLALSMGGGLFLGLCCAVFADLRDNKIRDLGELEADLGKAAIGVLPVFGTSRKKLPLNGDSTKVLTDGKRLNLLAIDEPRSPYVEALRALRTALLLSRRGAPPQTVLITSSIAGEGKSTLSMNLAVLMAQHGKKVLLVDSDLRRPMLHRLIGVDTSTGLSSILAGQHRGEPSTAIHNFAEVPGLNILCAGPVPPYPSELLGSDQLRTLVEQWKHEYDFILFDGAPVLPVTDSVILGGLTDANLLVARYGRTTRQSVDRSYSLLSGVHGADRTIGIVVNAVEQSEHSYYQYYGYSRSEYHNQPLQARAK